ncbi:MAG: PaaI family thioesterase [Deinococcota bacterium]
MVQDTLYSHQQPNSDYCFICGRKNPIGLKLVFFDNGNDEVMSTCVIPEHFNGYPGIVHGGIVSALLDEGVGRVSLIHDHHNLMMSVTLEVKFRQPVPTETELRIIGKRVKMRGRLGQAVGKLYLPDGSVAAESKLNLASLPAHILKNNPEALLGWQIDA